MPHPSNPRNWKKQGKALAVKLLASSRDDGIVDKN
jgi:hypothetical protein